jgi:hypothetical protein
MHLQLVQKDGSFRTNSAYTQAKDAHNEAMRLVEIAGVTAINSSDENNEERLQHYTIIGETEAKLRRALAEAPVLTVEDAKDKAAYFVGLLNNEWIEISQDDMKAMLSSFDKMDG